MDRKKTGGVPETAGRNAGFRAAAAFAGGIVLLLFLCAVNLGLGSMAYPPAEVWAALLGRNADPVLANILFDIRLPRILAALILGGALAVSGYLLQTFFDNPIAGPFVLGISSGAKMTVALVMVFALARGRLLSSAAMIAASFAGSLLSMAFILAIARSTRSGALLVVGGVMIGYICSAVTDFVVTFADDTNIVNLHNWSMGSFSGIGMGDVRAMAVCVVPALLAAFLMSKQMDACRLGEVYAASLGVNLRFFRAALIVLSGLLSACVTAFAGPVSFVGVAVPHLMKTVLGTAKPILLIPASFLGGAAACLFCDLLARTLFAPAEVSISSVTAVFGAPVVLWLLFRRAERRN